MVVANQGRTARLLTAAAFGVVAGLIAFMAGIPGRGEFLAAAWLAGALAVIVGPGWLGFLAFGVGIAATGVAADMSDGASGLMAAVIAALLAPGAHGALVGALGIRARRLGFQAASRDPRTVLGVVVVVALLAGFAWFANEFAEGPL